MALVIGFRPGDSVSIAGHHFAIDAAVPCLTDNRGSRHLLSGVAVSPVPDVHVRLADRQGWPGMLALAFEAPRDALLLRHAAAVGEEIL